MSLLLLTGSRVAVVAVGGGVELVVFEVGWGKSEGSNTFVCL